MSSPRRAVVLALVLLVLVPVVLSACPLCKEEVPDNGPGMWRGMYWSILLMVAMPFAMAGTIVVLVLRARRRHAETQGATLDARSQAATLDAAPRLTS